MNFGKTEKYNKYNIYYYLLLPKKCVYAMQKKCESANQYKELMDEELKKTGKVSAKLVHFITIKTCRK